MRSKTPRNLLSALLALAMVPLLGACGIRADTPTESPTMAPSAPTDSPSTASSAPEESPSPKRGDLVSYKQTGSLTAKEIAAGVSKGGNVSKYTTNEVSIYRVIYQSVYRDKPTQLSGLVMIPEGKSEALRIIQYHHGTVVPGPGSESWVPSNYQGGFSDSALETGYVGSVMASNGYAVSLPDYVGYGESAELEHAYTIHHELAEESVDMLRATKALLKELSKKFSGDVFLTGWSEGGAAALATHKYLQTKYPGEFNLRASSLLAGPYDYFGFIKSLLANRDKEYDKLALYSWGMHAINSFYPDLNRETESIWSYGVDDSSGALDVPSQKPSEVFQADFLDGIANETDAEWVSALKNNSLIEGWTPKGRLFFHSGTQDSVVAHFNSTNAHSKFKAAGADSKLYEYSGGNHYTPMYDYVTTTLNDFNNL